MNVRELIKRHEGLRFVPYYCSTGHKTVGFGHRILPTDRIPDDGINLEKAEQLLTLDILTAINGCRAIIPNYESLNDVRQAVCISMVFQLGVAGVSKFRRFLRWLEQWAYVEAAAEMIDSEWYNQTPARCEELANMMQSGEWA